MMPGVSTIVMTAIGPDRPGLVEALAQTIARHDGNWLDSHMAHLAGQFAGILRVEAPRSSAGALVRELHAMEASGLRITVHEHEETEADAPAPRLQVTFSVIGQDHPGIVARVSHVLASNGANVEELITGCQSAPMTGEKLFEAEATVSVPDEAAIVHLRSALEAIASDLMVDVHFED